MGGAPEIGAAAVSLPSTKGCPNEGWFPLHLEKSNITVAKSQSGVQGRGCKRSEPLKEPQRGLGKSRREGRSQVADKAKLLSAETCCHDG